MHSLVSTLFSPLLLSLLFQQAVQANSLTCTQLSSTTNIQNLQSSASQYSTILTEYWSKSCGALKPTCILAPANIDELSTIFKTLSANNDTFAVKSGGHNPNKNFASVQDGVLVSTINLNQVTFDSGANTVSVGPGNKWEDVMGVLDGTGVTVVGGRIGAVGVGGYLLGGGLSFLSTQYGWASNSIVAADMVLPNGTIAHVSNTSNPDILAAIKGGGSAFGVVTNYVLQAYPMGQVWGGQLVFGGDKTDQLLAAVQNFTENYPDPKAAIIATSELTAFNLVNIWIIFMFYDGPTPPTGVFDQFMNIGPTISNVKTQSYLSLLKGNDLFVLHDVVYTIATETTPLPSASNSAQVMRAYYDHWYNTSSARAGVAGMIASMAFQPIPRSLATVAKSKGGDLMNLDDSIDRIIFEFDYSYFSQIDDGIIDTTMVSLYSGMKDLVDGFVGNGTVQDGYRPLFMNDGYFRQDYWGRMDPNTRQFAQGVQRSVDPEGMFQTRTSAFKIPTANTTSLSLSAVAYAASSTGTRLATTLAVTFGLSFLALLVHPLIHR